MIREFYKTSGEDDPQETLARACHAWSHYQGVCDHALAQRLYDAVSKGWFMFASPVLSNAPTDKVKVRGLPVSCFLSYVPDSISGLIEHTNELRWLSVMGGGVGGHWSDVRDVSDIAPGPIPFIHTVDADIAAYKQGSTRKGSYAAYMHVDHPAIREFITLRVPTGDSNRKAFNLHNAVIISDEFMRAQMAGDDWEFTDPKTGPTGETVPARELWASILETRFRTGEPMILFEDTTYEAMPETQKDLGLQINGSNLCIEIVQPTSEDRTAVCCLSSPNAAKYDEWKDTGLIGDMVRMLDNVLDHFINHADPVNLKRAINAAKQERAIGIGLMGLHDYFQSHSVPFESEEAVEIGASIVANIKRQALVESALLAAERGEPNDMIGTGLRNAYLLAIAPNASSADLLGVSPSIEPNRANAYVRRTRAGTNVVQNANLKKIIGDDPELWASIMTNNGSVQHIDSIDDHTKLVYKTFDEIDMNWVIEHASERQRHVCQSQSVNLCFKPGVSRKHVREIHDMAWVKGLKSLYYLRTTSKQKADNLGEDVGSSRLSNNTKSIVYGKTNCPQCEMSKLLLDSNNIVYEYIDIQLLGKTAAEVTGRPDVRSLPQIYLHGQYIGGFEKLHEALKKSNVELDECKSCEG
jgi:ribonucleoside-diphosphate reductase alpha chain